MSVITRAKNILLSPVTEWRMIDSETETPKTLLVKYVIPMALVSAIARFIGFGLIGIDAFIVRIGGVRWGLMLAIDSFLSSLVIYYICTYVIDALAPNFNSPKNIGRSAQLVAYSYTAAWVADIFHIIPSLGILAILGLYGIYLFYVGLPVMKSTPEDNRLTYMIVSAIMIIVVYFVVGLIVENIIFAIMGNPLGYGGSGLNFNLR